MICLALLLILAPSKAFAEGAVLSVPPAPKAPSVEIAQYNTVSEKSLHQANDEVLALRQRVWDGKVLPTDFYLEVEKLYKRSFGPDYAQKLRTFLDQEAGRQPAAHTVDFSRMPRQDREDFFLNMPKGGELHVHLTGAGQPKTWMRIAEQLGTVFPMKAVIDSLKGLGEDPARYGLDLSKPILSIRDMNPELKGALAKVLVQNEHDKRVLDILRKWEIIDPITSNPAAFYPLLKDLALASKAQGILYLEAIESSQPSTLEAVARDAGRVEQETGVTTRILAYNRWGDDNKVLMKGMEAAARLDGAVVGFTMVADELHHRPLAHYEAFQMLREKLKGLSVTLHAGEVPGCADNIVNDLLLGINRYGHATQMEENPIAMALLYANKPLVEISLISNRQSGVMPDLSRHPLPKLLAWGVPVALSTDDPGVFGSNLAQEYETAQQQFNLSWEQLKEISRNSIRYAFADARTKARLMEELDQRLKAFENSPLFKRYYHESSHPSP